MYCVGCGEPLGGTEVECAHCKAAAVGSAFNEAVLVQHRQAVVVPWVCCCCLMPSDMNDDVKLSSAVLGGRVTLTIPIPWCAECRGLRQLQSRAAFVTLPVMWILGWVLAGIVLEDEVRYLVTVAFGFVATFAAMVAMAKLLPSLRQAGHVPACAAIAAGVRKKDATLRFRNRAFAAIWRDLQAGRESQATAMRRVVKPVEPVRDAARPMPTGAAAETAKKLAADAMREQMRRANAGPHAGARYGGALFAGGPSTGADAAASTLRFVAKECEFNAAGIHARGMDGRDESLAWADIVELRVRQLPAGPPYDGALLLDLVRAPAPDGAVRPLRILPTTRANYNALPGSGVTSQQNFRRLAAHVMSQNAAARTEPASTSFLNDGKAAPRLSSASEIVAYDQGFT